MIVSKVYPSLNQYINRILGKLDSDFYKLSKSLDEQNFERLMRLRKEYKHDYPAVFLNALKTNLNSIKTREEGSTCEIKCEF